MVKKKQKGFTLIEAILAVTISSMIIISSLSLLTGSLQLQQKGEREFDLQTSMRYTNELINQVVRYATAVFIIPASSFREGNLDPEWSYIGIQEDPTSGSGAREIVRFTPSGSGHAKEVLVQSREDLQYNLVFEKNPPAGGGAVESNDYKLIDVALEGYTETSTPDAPYWESSTKLEALNCLQVIDYSTAVDPGYALAYRMDERESLDLSGRVAMVLDNSGSMLFDLSGASRDVDEENMRVTYLRKAVDMMLTTFAKEDVVLEVGLFPFGYSANRVTLQNGYQTHEYFISKAANKHPEGGLEILRSSMAAIDPDQSLDTAITPGAIRGSTNTGDGIRRAMYSLMDEADSTTVPLSNYLIIVIDGETNLASILDGERITSADNKTIYLDRLQYFLQDGDLPVYFDPNETPGGWIATTEFNAYPLSRININGVRPSEGMKYMYYYDQRYTRGIDTVYSVIDTEHGYSPEEYSNSVSFAHLGDGYLEAVWNKLYPEVVSHAKIESFTTYLIALSSDVSSENLESLRAIMNIEEDHSFACTSDDELQDAFKAIGSAIVDDVWHISGPSLVN